jgi:hypothetical protein
VPRNNRKPTTVTRSISFRYDVLAALDERVETLRSDRSAILNGVLEHVLGIMPHPEIVGPNMGYAPDNEKPWAEVAQGLAKRAGGLIRRPGPRQ